MLIDQKAEPCCSKELIIHKILEIFLESQIWILWFGEGSHWPLSPPRDSWNSCLDRALRISASWMTSIVFVLMEIYNWIHLLSQQKFV